MRVAVVSVVCLSLLAGWCAPAVHAGTALDESITQAWRQAVVFRAREDHGPGRSSLGLMRKAIGIGTPFPSTPVARSFFVGTRHYVVTTGEKDLGVARMSTRQVDEGSGASRSVLCRDRVTMANPEASAGATTVEYRLLIDPEFTIRSATAREMNRDELAATGEESPAIEADSVAIDIPDGATHLLALVRLAAVWPFEQRGTATVSVQLPGGDLLENLTARPGGLALKNSATAGEAVMCRALDLVDPGGQWLLRLYVDSQRMELVHLESVEGWSWVMVNPQQAANIRESILYPNRFAHVETVPASDETLRDGAGDDD